MSEKLQGARKASFPNAVLRSLLRHTARVERSILAMVLLIAAAVWAFVELADEVMEGDSTAFDRAILLAFRNPADVTDPLGPPWVEELMRDITALGGIGVLTLLTLAVMAYLAMTGKGRAALDVGVSIGGGILVSSLLKYGFDRPRPDLVPHGSYVYAASFPSGHATMSAVVYLTLAALVARIRPGVRTKIYVLSMAIILTVLIGISRVYLGVHWPTDVLAGWVTGAAWAIMCWLVTIWLQSRGQVESEHKTVRD